MPIPWVIIVAPCNSRSKTPAPEVLDHTDIVRHLFETEFRFGEALEFGIGGSYSHRLVEFDVGSAVGGIGYEDAG